MSEPQNPARRRFLKRVSYGSVALTGIAGIVAARRAPAVVLGASRPQATWGLQIGDVTGGRAVIWSRSDRSARMRVAWSRSPSFENAKLLAGSDALESSDFTARVDLTRLPPNADIYVRVTFEDVRSKGVSSEPLIGAFRTPPRTPRDVRFVWSGDTAGQGWGIDLAFGGMKIYEAMRQVQPDFFIHCGDTIYADGPMPHRMQTSEGETLWRNAYLDEVPEKLKHAETLHEYRRNYLYNLYDANVRRFASQVPQIWKWDDHEVTNNWSQSLVLSTRYQERDLSALVRRAKRAFMEYAPIRWSTRPEAQPIHRHIPYGPDLDVFVVDMRSHRGPNSFNQQTELGHEARYLGSRQLRWLKRQLRRSRATWKVIAADKPLGVLLGDGKDDLGRGRWEGAANGDGPALGRELEMAELLRFIKQQRITNVVWLTADVHYCAAHYYDPEQAQFRDFSPFWEFVAGPLHASSFGPGSMDDTFGPRVVFHRAPTTFGVGPLAGFQSFGQVDIDHRTRELTVTLRGIDGEKLFEQKVQPQKS